MDAPSLFIQRHVQTGPKLCGGQDGHIGIALNISTGHSVRRRVGQRYEESRPRFGMMNLLAPGVTSEIHVEGHSKVLLVAMRWSDFASVLEQQHDVDTNRIEILTRHQSEDGELTRLLLASACGGPAAASAALPLLASHLLTQHSNRSTAPRPPRTGGLSPAKLRRLLDLIEQDIDAPLLLHQLAASVSLSMFHFAREFARMMGMPPHSYILKRRVNRALEAIASGHCSSAAAAAAGFVDTSHLARVFRSQYGLSLREFRRGALEPALP